MSSHRLDVAGKPIIPPSRGKPATRHRGAAREYHYSLRYRSPDGKQHHRHVWLRDDAAAYALEAKLRGQVCNGLTWGDAFAAWLEAHADTRGEQYLADVARLGRRFVAAAGDPPVTTTTRAAVATYLAEQARERSGRSAQKDRASLLAVARWARSQGLLPPDALDFEHIPKPEYKPAIRQPATPEEFHTIAAVLGDDMRALWLALGYTGSRFGGMAALREDDVATDYITTITKRSKVARYLITDPLRAALGAARGFKASRQIDSDYVFITTHGHRWARGHYAERLRTLCERHGLTYRSPHQLRHMAGTVAAHLGLTADEIQALLGHEARATSEQYIHHSQQLADSAAHRLVTFLSQQGPQAGDMGGHMGCSGDKREGMITCPRCGHNFNATNEKAAKP